MPNRMIKESICTSETLAQLTAEEERFFYRLLVNADDFGRFDGRPAVVLAACFPLQLDRVRVDDVEAWLQKLAEVDMIRFYEVGGRRYLYFPTWDKHQRKRAQHSKYPAPPADDRHVTVTCPSRDGHATDTCCSRNEKRESRNEKRETTDEMRACAHEEVAAATEGAESPTNQPISASVESVSSILDDDLAAVVGTPEWETVTDAYHDRIGLMGPKQIQQLAHWVRMKMAPEVIVAAIDEAVAAAERTRDPQKRRMSYIDGILRNWYNDGIRTAADLQARARADPHSPDYDPIAVLRAKVARWEQQYAGGDDGDEAASRARTGAVV